MTIFTALPADKSDEMPLAQTWPHNQAGCIRAGDAAAQETILGNLCKQAHTHEASSIHKATRPLPIPAAVQLRHLDSTVCYRLNMCMLASASISSCYRPTERGSLCSNL